MSCSLPLVLPALDWTRAAIDSHLHHGIKSCPAAAAVSAFFTIVSFLMADLIYIATRFHGWKELYLFVHLPYPCTASTAIGGYKQIYFSNEKNNQKIIPTKKKKVYFIARHKISLHPGLFSSVPGDLFGQWQQPFASQSVAAKKGDRK